MSDAWKWPDAATSGSRYSITPNILHGKDRLVRYLSVMFAH